MAGQSNDTALLQLWQHFGRHGARRFEVPHWGSRRRLSGGGLAKPSYYVLEIPVWVSSRISGGLTPLRMFDFLPFEKLNFFEMMLSKFPQFSTEQFLETSESEDPDFLGSLNAQNPGA